MIQISVLLPHRNAPQAVEHCLKELCELLESQDSAYEILVIDDGSTDEALAYLESLLLRCQPMRLLQLDRPRGVSAALSTGISAARGEFLVALEAEASTPIDEIPEFLDQLVRADLVYGRWKRNRLAKAWHRLTRIPRWLLLGLVVRDPGRLYWAARKEAVAHLELARGMFRYLPTLVCLRGYRVCEINLTARCPRRLKAFSSEWPNPGDLLTMWWLKRRRRLFLTHEVDAEELRRPRLKIVSVNESELANTEKSSNRSTEKRAS